MCIFAPFQELQRRFFFNGMYFLILPIYQNLNWLYNISSKLGLFSREGRGEKGGYSGTMSGKPAYTFMYLISTYLAASISKITSPQKLSDSLGLSNHSLLEHFCVIAKHTEVSILRQRPKSRSLYLWTVWSWAGHLNSLGFYLHLHNKWNYCPHSFFPPIVMGGGEGYICIICLITSQYLPLWVEYISFSSWFWSWPCDLIWPREG